MFSAAKARDAVPRRLLLRGGFSRVELGVRPYVDASACRRLGDLVGCGHFSSGGRRSSRMHPGKDAERLRHGAARPNRLTAVYLQCEGRQFPRASERQGPNRRRLASPIQHTSPVLSFGGFLTSRGGAELGQRRRVLQRPGGSRRYSPARPSSSGVSGCKNRLRAVQDVCNPLVWTS